ncbi:MAG: DUF2007-related protein [Bacteroides sp.]|nr:DUF2007 domain-containing protein [Bacteroides sp.]MDD2645625.1 DUF2007-related protein [Bacteroides sp.]MDD4054342.1 DUF2007-related protein [Bacteroides sp.]MDD4720197.1 DUF2007-related protein [Bacteroides sp.]NLI64470.1 DUF2007 domain-containing protein [Bacteroidales bacterium]
MKEEHKSETTLVFTGLKWEAEIIKGLLESNDIRCIVENSSLSVFSPYIDSQGAKIFVLNENAELAKNLIENKEE